MKNLKWILVLLIFSSCLRGEITPRVEQGVGNYEWSDGYKRYSTVVWSDGDIVWGRYDSMETLNDSIAKQATKEAKEIARIIKESK